MGCCKVYNEELWPEFFLTVFDCETLLISSDDVLIWSTIVLAFKTKSFISGYESSTEDLFDQAKLLNLVFYIKLL